MRVMQVTDGVPISTRAQSRGSREHSSKIWCVVLPIIYESNTAMSKVSACLQVQMHFFLCRSVHFRSYTSLPLPLPLPLHFTSARTGSTRLKNGDTYGFP